MTVSLRQERDDFRVENQGLLYSLEALEAELARVISELVRTTSNLNAVTSERDRLSREMKQLRDVNEALQAQVIELELENNELRLRVDQLAVEIERLLEQIARLQVANPLEAYLSESINQRREIIAAPVLKVMTEMQRADPVTRAAFVRYPRQRITEAVTEHLRSKGKLDGLSPAQEQDLIEQAAEPAFVETREYSERVIGLTVYVKPSIEIAGSGTTWLPEAFTGAAAETIAAMAPDQVERLIQEVETAIAAGEPTVSVGSANIPATPSTRAALEQRLETILNPEEPERRPVVEEEIDTRGGPIILDTAGNIEDLTWAAKVSPRTRTAPDTLPDVVKSDLKGHQTESFQWKLDAWAAGLPGVLNADEQGLGKTLQAIAFLAWMKDNMSRVERARTGPVLVVAPTSLLVNWEEEVDKHLRSPGLGNVIRLYGSALGGKKFSNQRGVETESGNALLDLSELEEAIKEGRGHRYWVLTTYTTLTNYQHSLAKIPFSTAVFDEIQAVKNPVSLRAKAALAVNADFRIGLTGTPIENSTTDLWAIMEQLTPGWCGSLKSFRERFGEPVEGNMR